MDTTLEQMAYLSDALSFRQMTTSDCTWKLYASDFAKYIDRSPFDSVGKAAKNLLKKQYPIIFEEALERCSAVDVASHVEEAIQTIQKDLSNVVEKESFTEISTGVTTLSDKVTQVLAEKNIQGVSKEDVQSAVRSAVYTQRGTRDEDKGLNKYETKTKSQVSQRNSKFYKRYVKYKHFSGKEREFLVGGRVDGITEDNVLVEVKNRQRRLFNEVRDYEMVQVQLYLLLTGCEKCHLIECLGSESITHTIHPDLSYWNQMLLDAKQFVQRMDLVLANRKWQDLLVDEEYLVDNDDNDEKFQLSNNSPTSPCETLVPGTNDADNSD